MNKSRIQYRCPDCKSAVELVPRSNDAPIPLLLPTDVLKEETSSSLSQSSIEASEFATYAKEIKQVASILFNHYMLNDQRFSFVKKSKQSF